MSARRKPYVRKSQRLRQQQMAEMRRLALMSVGITALIAAGYFISAHFVHGDSRLSRPEETVFVKQNRTQPPPPQMSDRERMARKLSNALMDKSRLQRVKFRNAERDVVEDDFYEFYALLPAMEIKVDAKPITPKLKHPSVLVVGNYRTRQAAINARYRWRKRSGVPLRVVPLRGKSAYRYQVQTPVLTSRLTYQRYRELLRKAGAKPYAQWVSVKRKRTRRTPRKIHR